MRSSLLRSALVVSLLMATLAACGGSADILMDPAPTQRDRADLGLGPGVRALTGGPGDKSSPRLDDSGERLTYVMDGYVVEKNLRNGLVRRRTTKDFGAREVFWAASGEGQIVLSPEKPVEAGSLTGESLAPSNLYRTLPEQNRLSVDPISTNVLTAARVPGSDDILAAFDNDAQSKLARLGDGGEVNRFYSEPVDGVVTGISLSGSGERALLTVRESNATVLYSFGLKNGTVREVVRVKDGDEDGEELLGVARKTRNGTYYVAGESTEADDTLVYDLYRLPRGTGREEPPEIVSDIGEDFIPSSVQTSPDGERLAVLGRRSLNSPANLYVLDLATGDLQTATSNENLEIKSGSDDLSWSADGESVVIVARAAPSEIKIRPAPADALTADFYNVYEVPVGSSGEDG